MLWEPPREADWEQIAFDFLKFRGGRQKYSRHGVRLCAAKKGSDFAGLGGSRSSLGGRNVNKVPGQ